jgi:predicted PurR-regulated permease PerM
MADLFFILTLLLFLAFDTTRTTTVMARLDASRPDFVAAMRNFTLATRSYIAVSAAFGLIVAVIDWGVLVVLGVPGAFVWAVLAFVTNFIPNIGFVIGVIPPAVIGLLEGGPDLMLAVIVAYSVINFVIQSVIQPRIVGDRVGLSATITFMSLVFWTWVIGPLGALLAVPLTLGLRAVLLEADPDAHWALPLVSGKPAPEEVRPEAPPELPPTAPSQPTAGS